jgi:hypothetical protein
MLIAPFIAGKFYNLPVRMSKIFLVTAKKFRRSLSISSRRATITNFQAKVISSSSQAIYLYCS